ncbi:MAG: hypothetical protein PHY42_07005 [Bacilli bacterium]|nr:hypothetical protein [Bacilli bacterium]
MSTVSWLVLSVPSPSIPYLLFPQVKKRPDEVSAEERFLAIPI